MSEQLKYVFTLQEGVTVIYGIESTFSSRYRSYSDLRFPIM